MVRRGTSPERGRRRPVPGLTPGLIVPGLVVVGLAVVLGPALLGRGVLLDVNSLSSRLPFRALTGAVYGDTITCRQDTIDYFPALAQIRASLLSGSLPTWGPYEVGGAPLAALPNTGFLTPLALPYFVLPLWLAPAFVKLGEVVVAIAGMIAFLRRRGVSRAGAWLAGFVFVTSGFMIAWSNWPQTRVAALIPLLLWATDRVVDRHRARDAVILALVFAAMLLGGFPAVTLYALAVAGVFALVRVWTQYRGRWREGVGALATAIAGLTLGVGLAAVQIVPFVLNLSAAFSGRDKGSEHLPLGAALTLLDPSARGDCRGGVWFGDVIPIEAIGYVGSATLVLAAVAIGFRRRRSEEVGTRSWLIGCLLVAAVLIWVGGPLLSVWQQLPVVGNNSITRAQSVVGFLLACLAGLGFDRLTRDRPGPGPRPSSADGSGSNERADDDDDDDGDDGDPRPEDEADAEPGPSDADAVSAGAPHAAVEGEHAPVRPRSRRPLVAGILAALALVVVTTAALLEARTGGYLDHLAGSLVVPALLLLAAAALVAVIHTGPLRLARWGPVALVVLVVAQGTAFAASMLPLSDRELLFPETPTHAFLQANIGHSRYGAGDRTMDAAISDWYHLRSPTGHEFTDVRWKDLLLDVDPEVERTVTYTAFSSSLTLTAAAESRILDRLAVRYWTATPRGGGEPGPVAGTGRVPLTEGEPARCRVDGGPLRGVAVRLMEEMPPVAPGTTPELHVRVTAAGETRTGSVLLDGSNRGPGLLRVAVAGEDLPDSRRAAVEVSVTGTDEPRYLAGEDRRVSCAAIRPTDDRMRLVFTDAGGAVYERLDALPRIRWASASRVVAPDLQVAALREGVPEDTVLLDDVSTPPAEGGTGSVTVAADDGDRIAVDTDATRPGYLVVADSIVRRGWNVTVDGVPAPLVRADHALAGVPVPAGRHRVELSYTAPGLRLGTAISIGSLLVSAVLLASPLLLRRRHRGSPDAGQVGTAAAGG